MLQRLESFEQAGVTQLAKGKRTAKHAEQSYGRRSSRASPAAKEDRGNVAALWRGRCLMRRRGEHCDAGAAGSGTGGDSLRSGGLHTLQMLADSRTQTVFGVGNPNAKICFFGEAPGADEDRLGEPFVGRGGQLLNKMLAACRLKREDVYIMNVLKCRPPENRNPLPDEVANCRGYFERQLEIIRPEIICCLGSVASKSLLNTETRHREVARQGSPISRHTGRVLVSSGLSATQSGGEGGCLGGFEVANAAAGGGAVKQKDKAE